ncbi:N-acetyl-L,L-diaminopimelate deacetylase [Methylophaga frappieri]|uniref:N-acetyl-L,L-diaminopimelate deacetylase n=1 Tax=Methylophaga frappieri (strain ATCC BAA-2434 / DSM 25690 / JAM7) TaxID=754477 RepID=I1YFZ5_METFJ|nr:N(2)-acetyl-L-2,4-diaminobutanoate deacetylase DoeB2 [Methylophaga frappieri]AFJ01838.1 N-acetyl-L,L-diaminopimelate deacetylase [Methylophaga frappieri]
MSAVWQKTITGAKAFRRDLHTYPEQGWQEQRTATKVREMLTQLDINWRVCAQTGTVATLAADKPGAHIALRGDMDALPITEQTTHPWASRHSGTMHACGHDGHTATLMAAAQWLKHHENRLSGPVSFIFQPAEEGGHGAREMIHDGALEGVDCIYGWHNWPAIPFGKLVCPDDIVMCGNGTFEITVTGQGGHASQPELCRDPVLAASAITLNLQQIISRRLPPQQAAVLSVTSIEAPSAATVIPQQAKIGGSIRVPDTAVRAKMNQLIEEIAQQTAASYGVNCEVTILPRYEATINHAAPAQQIRDSWRAMYTADALHQEIRLPIMASEDFSYYLQEIPGAFALIGSDDGPEHQAPCHSPHYDFNDRLIPLVTALFARLVGAPLPEELN